MKKFFSLFALVAVFAACQPEKVQTAFTVAGATATINVQVFNVNTGAAYDGQYNLAASEGSVSGNTVAIESPSSTGISKHDVTLTVTGPKLAKSYTYTSPYDFSAYTASHSRQAKSRAEYFLQSMRKHLSVYNNDRKSSQYIAHRQQWQQHTGHCTYPF